MVGTGVGEGTGVGGTGNCQKWSGGESDRSDLAASPPWTVGKKMTLQPPVTQTAVAEINASHEIESRWHAARHPENAKNQKNPENDTGVHLWGSGGPWRGTGVAPPEITPEIAAESVPSLDEAKSRRNPVDRNEFHSLSRPPRTAGPNFPGWPPNSVS